MPDNSGKDGKESKFLRLVKKLHPFTDFFVMLLLVCIVCFTLPKSIGIKDNTLAQAENKISELEKKVDEQNVLLDEFDKIKNSFVHIEVEGIGSDSIISMNQVYTVAIQNVKLGLSGEWKSNDFMITNNEITPKHEGQSKIEYLVNDKVIASKTFNVTK